MFVSASAGSLAWIISYDVHLLGVALFTLQAQLHAGCLPVKVGLFQLDVKWHGVTTHPAATAHIRGPCSHILNHTQPSLNRKEMIHWHVEKHTPELLCRLFSPASTK